MIRRFARFATVGTAGYLVNLAVYSFLLHVADTPYLAAASGSFAVAVTHNYLVNRAWTFADAKGAFFGQGARFLIVSLLALATNLAVLHLLVVAGAGELLSQAIAVAVALPVNFVGNVLWSFRRAPEIIEVQPASVYAPDRTQAPPRAVICLPTYNERENLEAMVRTLGGVRGAHDLVLVIDDNSPDGTGQLADGLADQLDFVHVLHRPAKQGLGPAYLEGFRYALSLGATRIIEMDCDFSHDPADVPRLIAATDRADLALGSRYVAGGSATGLDPGRGLISRGGCLYARRVLGVDIRDLTTGFKCYRREALLAIGLDRITSSGYVFQIETTYLVHRAGLIVREIPIQFGARAGGASKMSLRIAAEAAWRVPLLRGRARRMVGCDAAIASGGDSASSAHFPGVLPQ